MIGRLLIANRGEVAIRISRTAADLGIGTVGIYSEDDTASLHIRRVDEAVALRGAGPEAYLDIPQVLDCARRKNCDAIHPGYGFLAENADFAAACAEAGITFVGPSPGQLRLLGDKGAARALAERCGVPVLPGISRSVSVEEARAFLADLGPEGSALLKAVHGGGGRGIRLVDSHADMAAVYRLCRSEAARAFGRDEIYIERYLPSARHIEVQMAGDGAEVCSLGERDCSLQRRRQKVVEIAPPPNLPDLTRRSIVDASVAMARDCRLSNLATFEFLVPLNGEGFFFIEANPRLQVEHTVSEAVTGLDLVRIQLQLAADRSLFDLGLAGEPPAKGVAIEARINLEEIDAVGAVMPASGVIEVFEPPSGPSVRVDACGYAGWRIASGFDSLAAKLIVYEPEGDLRSVIRKAIRALSEFRIEGAATNIPFLVRLLSLLENAETSPAIGFIDENSPALAPPSQKPIPKKVRPDHVDPLAIFEHGRSGETEVLQAPCPEPPPGSIAVLAPIQGTVVAFGAARGESVRRGAAILVLEAMKMEHEVVSDGGLVREILVDIGDSVASGQTLAFIEPTDESPLESVLATEPEEVEHLRSDLAEVVERQSLILDPARPEAVARRRAARLRTARENIADLCDPGAFVEVGGLAVAARRTTTSLDDLTKSTPADGFVTGLGRVNGALFAPDRSRVAVLSYDPTVMAGTQGWKGHEKLDRMCELAHRLRLPVVFFTEGGGGRPGDVDKRGVGFNFVRSFTLFARLSGLVPMIAVNNGRCFAGNAFILGCCDVVIATKSSTIGIGGPAVIEGAGLGTYRAEEVGPVAVQTANGVIDIVVDDEAAAVAAARKFLAYFQGPTGNWRAAEPRRLRRIVPENHRRAYDMRSLITVLSDSESVLELRPQFGRCLITALIRIEGRPIGMMANDPHWFGGAIDSDGADKAARFMKLCEAHGLPILSLCDTPGYMVGPEAEREALIRHCARMVVVGSNLTVPLMIVVVRKAYGLGGLAMAGGSFSNAILAVAWPTGEFGGMPVEGYVKLGFRDELAAISDPKDRQARFEELAAAMYV
ncbi:MAG: carboxyl transferase domain-containing protein, partial [Caulobacteraceae bacterium]